MGTADPHEALDDCVFWLEEARALIRELAADLKHFYEPEKGWPPSIEHAMNIDGDLDSMIGSAREALSA